MSTPLWFRRHLYGGETGHDAEVVNRKLGVMGDEYTEATRQLVRGAQALHGLPVTGDVDAATAAVLGEAADHELPPEWFTRDLEQGSTGVDVAALRDRLGLSDGVLFDTECRRAVLRFQSAHGLPLTGRVDLGMSRLLP